jgi:signal transduction histidine kinase
VACYSRRGRALWGLAVCAVAVMAIDAIRSSGLSSWTFSTGAVVLSWGVGRTIRARRAIVAELKETTDRIAAERDLLERLAVAEQRTNIAHELQRVVAESISTMIVQAQAARRLLDVNLQQADDAMETIEDTGRAALGDMRRILGALRHPDAGPDLAPPPGVGQIAELVDRTRQSHRRVGLRVEGDPRPVPAGVDIAVYRVLEDAIATTGLTDDKPPLEVTLTFGLERIELEVQLSGGCPEWPTPAMQDLVELGDGTIDSEHAPGSGERLTIRFPTNFARITT